MTEPAPRIDDTPGSADDPGRAPQLRIVQPPADAPRRRVRDLISGLVVMLWGIGAVVSLVLDPPRLGSSAGIGEAVGGGIAAVLGLVGLTVLRDWRRGRPAKHGRATLVLAILFTLLAFIAIPTMLSQGPVETPPRADAASTDDAAPRTIAPESAIDEPVLLKLHRGVFDVPKGWTHASADSDPVQFALARPEGRASVSVGSFRGPGPQDDAALDTVARAYTAEMLGSFEVDGATVSADEPLGMMDEPVATVERDFTITTGSTVERGRFFASFNNSMHRFVLVTVLESPETPFEDFDDAMLGLMTDVELSLLDPELQLDLQPNDAASAGDTVA